MNFIELEKTNGGMVLIDIDAIDYIEERNEDVVKIVIGEISLICYSTFQEIKETIRRGKRIL